MTSPGFSVRLHLVGNFPGNLSEDTIAQINKASIFRVDAGEELIPNGLRRGDLFYIDEAIDFLMLLRHKENIRLVFTQMPVLDKHHRETFGLAVEGESEALGVGMVSTSRLLTFENHHDDLKKLASERIAKEALHELGHAIGLTHCRFKFCAMARSLEPEDVDMRQLRFCPNCLLDLELKRRKMLS